MKTFATTVILLMLTLAGCTGDNPPHQGVDQEETNAPHSQSPSNSSTDSSPIGPPNSSSGPAPHDNTTTYYDPGWPSLEEATIRPGSAYPDCTSNFIFKSLDNKTFYIGSAAHCLKKPSQDIIEEKPCEHKQNRSLPLGTNVTIEGATKPGKLLYSSWNTMYSFKEENEDACANNDFALVEIDEGDRERVHPAMIHYGGPTGLGNSSMFQVGDRVLSYGTSELHFGLEDLKRREGYIIETSEWETSFYGVSPAVFGDSGSAIIAESGKAIGVLTHFNLYHPSGSTGFVNLDRALAYMHEHTDLEVELATWPLLEKGVLPDLP